MKFAIGYQRPENGESFQEIVRDYRESLAEVYFPWPGAASGRAALGKRRGATDWDAQAVLEDDLRFFKAEGVKLDLLFNANCYGGRAVSQSLENEVLCVIERIGDVAGGADIVTTTSPFIARTVKKHFPNVEVRASVNARIGTTQAMGYASELFDSFYVQRDLQRDLNAIRPLKSWCDKNGKGLYMLANSGCLRYCPSQTFHDNAVAHDAEIDETKNVAGWTPHLCWSLYRDPARFAEILKATWVRPEDTRYYDDLFPVVKLATRQHSHPRMVIDAYANRKFRGNLLDLFEPCFSPIFAPAWIDNGRFPDDWFARSAAARPEDPFFEEVLRRVLVRAE